MHLLDAAVVKREFSAKFHYLPQQVTGAGSGSVVEPSLKFKPVSRWLAEDLRHPCFRFFVHAGMIARLATADDFLRYAGRMPPAEWCIEGRIIGYTAERLGEIVGLGFVTWDEWGRAWGWLEKREALPTLMMHRKAKAMLALLREVREPALYAFCSQTIPGSEKWLRRLGFVADPKLTTDPDHPVWKCDLSWSAEARGAR